MKGASTSQANSRRCKYCTSPLALTPEILLAEAKGGARKEFCSQEHRQKYHQERRKKALELLDGMERTKPQGEAG